MSRPPASTTAPVFTPVIVAASFTAPTFTVTVADALLSVPSVATYVKFAGPLKFSSGVNVTVPSPLRTTVPPVPAVTDAMLSVSPSASVSLPSKSAAAKITSVSSVAVNVSSFATGGLLAVMLANVGLIGTWAFAEKSVGGVKSS